MNLNTPITTLECSNEITITITITNKNYNYSNNYDIFIISDYISVYADHAIDKQISSKAIEYLISVGPTFRYSMPSLLAGVGQLSQLAKLIVRTHLVHHALSRLPAPVFRYLLCLVGQQHHDGRCDIHDGRRRLCKRLQLRQVRLECHRFDTNTHTTHTQTH